jgi:DNA-directed RNA polymerase alpha subunit
MKQEHIETMNTIVDLVAGGKKISQALGDVYEKRCVVLPFMEDIMDDPIENLRMTGRTYNALMRAKMRNIGDVVRFSDGGDFSRIRNFGRLSGIELFESILNYCWARMDVDQQTNFLIDAVVRNEENLRA